MSNLAISSNSSNESPFDSIRRFDQDGNEFWLARELMPLLGYAKWQFFDVVIDKAIASCLNAEGNPESHFTDVSNLVKRSQGGGSKQSDYRLSRYACYLTAMNGDPRKPEIASAQTYFAIKTREAETIIPAQIDRIKELELELALAQAQTQKAIAEKSVLDTRRLIVATCPEPVQQRIFGYQVVKEIEYRDRVIKDGEIINHGETVSKDALCRRYGLMTRTGNPNYKLLNVYLDELGITNSHEMWKSSVTFREIDQFKREFLSVLDEKMLDANRQLFIGE